MANNCCIKYLKGLTLQKILPGKNRKHEELEKQMSSPCKPNNLGHRNTNSVNVILHVDNLIAPKYYVALVALCHKEMK